MQNRHSDSLIYSLSMKRIGLLGGMSWESSVEYERIINQAVRAARGGVASADLIIRSFNFAEIESLQASGDWESAGELLSGAAVGLQNMGAEAIVLCTNTMHKVADQVESAISIPFLHIADATAKAIKSAGLSEVLLLGTKFTMEQDFYTSRLASHGISAIVPTEIDRELVHKIIYEELVQGVISESSKAAYLKIIAKAETRGIRGVIAGCTEIELLVQAEDLSISYFPTTYLHATTAAEFCLSGE